MQKKLVTEKKESTSLPIDRENSIIIVPKDVEVSLICTNLNSNFEDLAKREEVRKRREANANKPKIDTFVRKDFIQQKKRLVKPQPIDRVKAIDNCVKLERAINGLEKEIETLQKGEQKSNEQKQKEINEINQLQTMITKWKSAAQEGIIELHKLLSEHQPDMTLSKLVDLLKVDPKEIDFNPAEGDFNY